jgi:uncharacterized membrane protein
MKVVLLRFSRTFLTGLLAVLPVAATVLLSVWVVRLLLSWMGPNSLLGRVLAAFGLRINDSVTLGYVLGLGIFTCAVWLVGLLIEANLQRGLARLVDGLMRRIPLVRNIYDVIQKFVHLLSERKEDKTRTLTPIWCHFGGKGGTAVLGLLSTPEPIDMDGAAYYGVLVPTAPVPVGGGLLYVPCDWVSFPELSIEAVTSIYVSMGVTSAQYLPSASAHLAVKRDDAARSTESHHSDRTVRANKERS